MIEEVKKRIDQIRHGIVPEGYKKGKLGIVPGEWDEIPFSTLFTSTSDYTDNLHQYPLFSVSTGNGHGIEDMMASMTLKIFTLSVVNVIRL